MRLRLGRLLTYPQAQWSSIRQAGDLAEGQLEVWGLVCDHCARRVERSISAVPGVAEARVDLEAGRARVLFDPAAAQPSTMVRAAQRAVILPWARRLLAYLPLFSPPGPAVRP